MHDTIFKMHIIRGIHGIYNIFRIYANRIHFRNETAILTPSSYSSIPPTLYRLAYVCACLLCRKYCITFCLLQHTRMHWYWFISENWIVLIVSKEEEKKHTQIVAAMFSVSSFRCIWCTKHTIFIEQKSEPRKKSHTRSI